MNFSIALLLIGLVLALADRAFAPPVNNQQQHGGPAPNHKTNQEMPMTEEENIEGRLEYGRYLREVVNLLESDDSFRQKIQGLSPDQIWDGSISSHLEVVNLNVRTKLDELKRQEVNRLREIGRREMQIAEMNQQHIGERLPADFGAHVDSESVDGAFEAADLKQLIQKTKHDMEMIDRMRAEEFRRYEMQKELDFRQSIQDLPMEDKVKKVKERDHEKQARHDSHQPVHHPGSEDQLQEVWEQQDHQNPEDFSPKIFFKFHDLNDDGFLDPGEVESLFIHELNKVYDPSNNMTDVVERYEDMNRMRQHFVSELDKDGDYLISLNEFLRVSNDPNYKSDKGWETVADQATPGYTEDDLREFEQKIEQHRSTTRTSSTQTVQVEHTTHNENNNDDNNNNNNNNDHDNNNEHHQT